MACAIIGNFVLSFRWHNKQTGFSLYNKSIKQRLHWTKSLKQMILTPQEVNAVLRANEYTHDFNFDGPVKSYDSNQLPSNNPMEDARAEARCLLKNRLLIGVFDGHGGAACAQVLAKRLFKYISVSFLDKIELENYIKSYNNDEIPLLENFNDNYDFVQELKDIYHDSFKKYMEELKELTDRTEVKSILESTFLRMDEDLSKEAQLENSPVDVKTLLVGLSGAVACTAYIDGLDLHIASVGDCQAVLGTLTDSNTWIAKKLSIEHNSDNGTEVERILNEHPISERDTVIRSERLLGQLAPLRAFGDMRYKWSRKIMESIVVSKFGEQAMAPNYYTPPYLTAKPDVTFHRLTPRDKFLVIASDGLWDFVSPNQVVKLVGEHMSGKVTLTPLRLPRRNMKLNEISTLLRQRQEGLDKVPLDNNAATHLIRHALGGTEYGVEYSKLSQLLSIPQDIVRQFRDDITATVVYFDSDFIRHCPI